MTEETTPGAELRSAVRAISQALTGKAVPTRHDARALLVPLGQLALDHEEDEATLAPYLAEVRPLIDARPEAWALAMDEEISLASAEHVQAVDPRFLEHPRYDFGYTVAARARLEARLQACQVLGHPVPEAPLDRIARADEALRPYLERGERA